MHTSLFKTSLYTRSLLANPPAALPQIPTLAELKERTASIPIPIATTTTTINTSEKVSSSSSFGFGWSGLPKSLLPAYSGPPPPQYAPSSVKSSWSRLSDDCGVKPELVMKGSKAYVRDGRDKLGTSCPFLTLTGFGKLMSR